MLGAIESIDGLRAWRDKLISPTRNAACRAAGLDGRPGEGPMGPAHKGSRAGGHPAPPQAPGQPAPASLAPLQGGLPPAKTERGVRPPAAPPDVMIPPPEAPPPPRQLSDDP